MASLINCRSDGLSDRIGYNLESKKYRKYIANMQEDVLEEWYDELYQMILLAIFELYQSVKLKLTD